MCVCAFALFFVSLGMNYFFFLSGALQSAFTCVNARTHKHVCCHKENVFSKSFYNLENICCPFEIYTNICTCLHTRAHTCISMRRTGSPISIKATFSPFTCSVFEVTATVCSTLL